MSSSEVQDIVAGAVEATTSVERDRGKEATTSVEHGRGREAITNPARGRRNKSKSVDAIAALEQRLEKVELAVGDTGERVKALEQHGDELEGQVEELKGELVGQVGELKESIQVVSDTMARTCVEELGSFKVRVMETLATFEAKMRALSTFEEKLDKMRANWALRKRVVTRGATTSTSREVPTIEVPKPQVFNGNGGGDEGSRDHPPKEGAGKPSTLYNGGRRDGKPKEDLRDRFKPRTNCFLCDGPHWSRDCPRRKALSAMLEEQEPRGSPTRVQEPRGSKTRRRTRKKQRHRREVPPRRPDEDVASLGGGECHDPPMECATKAHGQALASQFSCLGKLGPKTRCKRA